MLDRVFSKANGRSLMGDYASLLADASLRDKARTAEKAARIEAELASRVKSEFVANMSHELRTPLNTVMGFSKLLTEHGRRKLPEADIVEYAELIHDAASHLLTIINEILDISKMQSGKYTLDATEVALDEILGTCLNNLKPMAAESNVIVDMVQQPYRLPLVRGDSVKLRQVFTNIIGNAIKFTAGRGTVTIEAVARGDTGISVHIRDTGVGMTAEEVRIALTPFGQVDASHSRWREGTGLGLPISRSLVELHGGQLSITSRKGEGTEVSIEFPAANQVSLFEGRYMAMNAG
jgi:two-component system, cell cycle sensor histidine kinase PleC